MESAQRPTWQHSDCPAWCVQEHQETDHPDDRSHVSEAICVPVVRLLKQFEGDELLHRLLADELTMLVFQPQHDTEPWLSLCLAQQGTTTHIHLSYESAQRLTRSLHALLDQVRPVSDTPPG